MAEKQDGVLTTIGDTLTIRLDPEYNTTVGVATAAATDASAVVVLETSVNEDDYLATQLKLYDGTTAANLTGASKAGYADLPAAKKARVRLTALSAGSCYVEANQKRG
jgi:hypothetical protein